MMVDINTQYITKHDHFTVIIDQISPFLPVYTVFGHIIDHHGHVSNQAWLPNGSVWGDKISAMDLIEAPNFSLIHPNKDFNYFGTTFNIHKTYQFITTDNDGTIRSHYTLPTLKSDYWYSPNNKSLGEFKYNGDWTQSQMDYYND